MLVSSETLAEISTIWETLKSVAAVGIRAVTLGFTVSPGRSPKGANKLNVLILPEETTLLAVSTVEVANSSQAAEVSL